MSHLLGSLLSGDKTRPVRVALTQIYGIGRKKAIQVCQQLGFSDSIRVSDLKGVELEKIVQIIGQKYLVDSELKEEIHKDKKRLSAIGCFRGIKQNKTG